ncbi:MFS transporter [Actinoplanes derwentensis]|uniref:Uncharacterized protein n=1 Tax=Actinoplanes derwentensis TaxID=113562 RepID=A0A1H2CKT8_9ACTN|nr:MFS transporter [Actinoplanes derwentensis]SDT71128.1 hypothetical protein SAMN04489716_6095 [Actinoplanes derwentensis]
MAFRSWLKLLAATVTAAAVIGAGQLGIAYGLGMVRLDQTLEITQRDQWTAQLAWIAWITMTAAALGAVVATALRPRWSPRPVSSGGALAMGLAAGIGALAVLPLTMQPARDAHVTGVHPVLIIGICAGLGAAIGIFAGYAAAARAVARWSLATLSVIVWAVALVSIAPSLKPGGTPADVRLGVLSGNLIPAAVAEHTPFATMPAIALLTGLIIGWIARSRRMSTLTVALSGLAGPAMLTLSYLIAGPGSASGFALNPYWAAMTASGAGVLGSVLAAIVRSAPKTAADTPGTGTGTDAPGTASGTPGAASGTLETGNQPDTRPDTPSGASPEPEPPAGPKPESVSGRASLPRRDVPNESAIAQAAAAAALRPEDQLRPSDTGIFTMGDRPHPLQDLAATPPAAPVPFPTGNPFHQGTPAPQNAPGHQNTPGPQATAAPHRTPTGAHARVQPSANAHPHSPTGAHAQAHAGGHAQVPTGAHAQVPAPGHGSAQFAAPASIPAQVAGLAPAQVSGPDAEPRFSGQQPAQSSGGGQRRGWRTRRNAPEPEAQPGSFNGFASGPEAAPQQTGPQATAPQSAQRGRPGGREDDYVGWVNDLGR